MGLRVNVRMHIMDLGKFYVRFLETSQDPVKKDNVHHCIGTVALYIPRPIGRLEV